MDIQQTYAFLETNFHPNILKYFKKQTIIFNLKPTTTLKEYLDKINDDPVSWLTSFPDDLTCKSAFHQYKLPIYKLLKHTKLHEDYTEQYCDNLLKNIKQAFITNCQDIIDKRKNNTKTIDITTDDTSVSETQSNDGSTHSNYEPQHLTMQDKYESMIHYYKASNEQLVKSNEQLIKCNELLMKLLASK